MTDEFTALITTLNRESLLRRTLESVVAAARQDPNGWEVLVVDNGSSDGTVDLVGETARSSPVPMRCVVEPVLGVCAARNRGIRESTGDLIAFLDDDVRVREDWVARLREAAARFPGAAAFGGRVVAEWSQPPPSWLTMDGPYELRAGAYVAHDRGDETYRYDVESILPVTANAAVRRRALGKHGGFRTDLDRRGKELLSGGDTELFRRLVRAGEEVVYLPEVVVFHPVFPERVTKRYMRRWHFHYGRTEVRMHGIPNGSVRWWGVPRHMFRELLGAGGRCAAAGVMLQPRRFFFEELGLCRVLGRIKEARSGTVPLLPPSV